MVPHRRRPLVVVVLEDRAPGCPRLPVQPLRLGPEPLVEGANASEARRDVTGRRQIPGLRETVALLARVPPMQVRHDRYRPRVPGRIGAVRVRSVRTAGGIGPVQSLVDRQQMRQVVPVRVHEPVDPLDPHRLAPAGLDREGGVIEGAWVVGRAVAPDGRRQAHGRGQDVLLELAYGDLVVVDALRPRRRKPGAARHRRRDHQRRHVLRDAARRKRPARDLCQRRPRAEAKRQKQRRPARDAVLEQAAPRHPDHRRPPPPLLTDRQDARAPRCRSLSCTLLTPSKRNGTKSNTARAPIQG